MRIQPLHERKQHLAKVIAESGILFSANLEGEPGAILEQVGKLGLEGVVAKRRASTYEPGERSGAWVKVQLKRQQEFVIGGYIPESGVLRSIAVGYYENGKLVFAGKVRAGFGPFNRKPLTEKLRAVETSKCPFNRLKIVKSARWGEGLTEENIKEIHWVRPSLVAQIKFTEWTNAGNLRHAEYLGLRIDKNPKDVLRERGS